MAFVRHKKINGRIYAYETTSYWDAVTKKPKHRSKYLGLVKEDGAVVKCRALIEKLILDFGDGYLVNEYLKNLPLHKALKDVFGKRFDEMNVLLLYKLIEQSSMYNCKIWYSGNVASKLYPKADVSSQNTSAILSYLGNETLQRQFFQKYIKQIGGVKKSIIVDATSLPNQIHSEFTEWGHGDGGIAKQIRLLCVVDQESKLPLYYRYLPGNIVDISALKTTLAELAEFGVESTFALLDAGFFSDENVKELYKQKIDFMTRMPASRTMYKEMIGAKNFKIEMSKNVVTVGKRGLFICRRNIKLYGHKAYAYIVLDPLRKGKELNELIVESAEEDKKIAAIDFNGCGVMILVSSRKIPTNEVVQSYYIRQSVERVFGFYKDDLDSLPLRRHNEDTIRGYLFLQFLVLIIFVKLRTSLERKHTVEQAMMIMRALKCKVYDSKLIIAELTKEQKLIIDALGVIVPKTLGI